MILLVEKINRRFRVISKAKQASGLSVCLNMIRAVSSEIVLLRIDTLEDLESFLVNNKPKKVILQALCASYDELKALTSKHEGIKFYIHIHSNIPFLSVEGIAIERIEEARRLGIGLVFNDERAAYAFNGTYLPNVYERSYKQIKPKRDGKPHIDIICAGSLRPMKNQLIQAIASIKYAEQKGKKLRFHMNLDRSEGGGEVGHNLRRLFQGSRHELVTAPWMSHEEFIRSLESMDMGLQVSLSESFNITAADYTAAGIPMVVSQEVRWASQNIMAETGCVYSIVSKMEVAHLYTLDNRAGLTAFSLEAERLWNEFVKA